MYLYRRGWRSTLAGSHENPKLELPRAWEPLDNSKPSQDHKGTSSLNLFSNGNQIGQRGSKPLVQGINIQK